LTITSALVNEFKTLNPDHVRNGDSNESANGALPLHGGNGPVALTPDKTARKLFFLERRKIVKSYDGPITADIADPASMMGN
jgi:hypothetical protein